MKQKSHQLFFRIIEKLGAQGDPHKHIPEILGEVCRFFQFGCGFIYRSDHAGLFTLSNEYHLYDDVLPGAFKLPDLMDDSEIEEFLAASTLVIKPNGPLTDMKRKLAALFSSNLLVLIPVLDTSGHLMSIVGITDRRSKPRLSDEDFDVALSSLMVIANQVRLHMYQIRIEDTTKALESIMDNMGIDIYVNDFNTHEILYVNQSMAEPYGGKEAFRGKICWQALYDDKTGECEFCPQKKLIDEEGNPTKVYSWDYRRPFDGSWFRVFSAAFNWMDGRLAHVVSSVDITENKQYEETIRHMAEYDSLTGLPNRRKLVADIDHSIISMKGQSVEGYVIFFDLDDFKQVNDVLGHRAGDELLAQVGTLLEGNNLTRGHGYRHSGDEFVLSYENTSFEQLCDVLRFLHDVLNRPWELEDGVATCPASFGVAHYPSDAQTAAELVHLADLAMYASKQSEKGSIHLYNKGNCIRLGL